ncbi:CPBP family intramembrane metalloprotease [Enterococcus lactis]|nr:CPBP family intramembrane metalloprotease [Enterococcus lactis]
MQYILGPTNQSANQEYLSQLGKQTPLFLTLIVFAFFGPILEELIFRHLLINWLSQSIGLILSSLISIFLFTFIHVTHPIDFFHVRSWNDFTDDCLFNCESLISFYHGYPYFE